MIVVNKLNGNIQSILKGLFFLAEESFRSHFDDVGLRLRRSLLDVTKIVEESGELDRDDSWICSEDLEELFNLLDITRNFSEEQRATALAIIEEHASCSSIH